MKNKNIQYEQVAILYKQSFILFLATLFIIGLLIVYFTHHPAHTAIQIWAIIMISLTIARMVLVYRYQQQPERFSSGVWLNAFALGALLSGMAWGILVWIIHPVVNEDILLIVVIYTGMTAGALTSLSSYLPAYIGFSVSALLSLAYYMLVLENAEHFVISLLVTIYLLSMIGFSILVNKNIIDTIKLRFSNLDLLAKFKTQKEAAEKANIDKSRFLAATSHDLRQPLHTLDLYLGALQERKLDSENKALLEKATKASQVLSELLNALMDISRLDAGGLDVHDTTFSLADALSAVCEEFQQSAAEKDIVFDFELSPVTVTTDPLLLTQMVRNLISNAIKHNTACALNVITRVEEDVVDIIVRDSGQGIDETELENIFSEFYQLNNPERDRTKGLGLGLAIVKRLSRLLDIPIFVESRPGYGSEFRLRLRCTEPLETKTEIIHELATGKDLSGVFIFIVDDEESVRDAIRTLLRSWGCEVLTASSQQQLMEQVKQENYPVPDLILTDYRLRDKKTGIGVVKAVRQFYQQLIPACIITGDSSPLIERQVRKINGYLVLKPVTSQLLRKQIESIITT